jgi:transposase InsO family protein
MSGVIAAWPKPKGAPSVGRLCRLSGLSPATYYRYWKRSDRLATRDTEVRSQIQQVALEMPRYGYRRITAELRRRGCAINHKRVLRLMRSDNLLCLRKKAFCRTTDSAHGLPVYPNLVPALQVNATDQLWVADITYIRLQREFVYLAVVLDAYSRRCIGWALGRRLTVDLPLAALEKALATRQIKPGLVHHSDQGVQYASGEYTGLLKAQAIRISMSRRGNPYDNAQAESFMKTLKYEEVNLSDYENYIEAYDSIERFLEEAYNCKRLHSALGYRPPVEFEAGVYS